MICHGSESSAIADCSENVCAQPISVVHSELTNESPTKDCVYKVNRDRVGNGQRSRRLRREWRADGKF